MKKYILTLCAIALLAVLALKLKAQVLGIIQTNTIQQDVVVRFTAITER